MNTNTNEQGNNVWRKNIYEAIKNISDLNSQRIIWLGKSWKYESSFDEYMMNLYDDFEFEEFISESNWKNMHLTKELFLEMNKLNVLLNNFDKNKRDSEILTDNDWYAITIQAKKVISMWDQIS